MAGVRFTYRPTQLVIIPLLVALALGVAGCGRSGTDTGPLTVDDVKRAFAHQGIPLRVFFVVFPKGVAHKKGNALVLLKSDPPVTDLLDVDVFGSRTTVPATFRFDIFSGKTQPTARNVAVHVRNIDPSYKGSDTARKVDAVLAELKALP